MEDRIQMLKIEQIVANQHQPRTAFDEDKLVELAQSIKQNGIIQPIIVRQLDVDQYELVAGERRYRASILAGLTEVPSILQDYSDLKSAEIAIIENIQREDLSPIEEAVAYSKLIEIHGLTQEQLGKRLGKSQGSIANKLRLIRLPNEVKDALMSKQISERHARALLGLKEEPQMLKALNEVLKHGLTVNKTEQLVERRNGKERIKEERIQKGITQDIRIAVNTIKKTVDMVRQTGVELEVIEESDEKEHRLLIKFKKKS